MSIYEFMEQLGYAKHQQYPNGFERFHKNVKIAIIFNYKERSATGRIVPVRTVKKQNDIDNIQEAYHIMLDDLQKIADIGIIVT